MTESLQQTPNKYSSFSYFNSQQQEDCKMFFISSLFLALLLSTILFFHKQRKQTYLPPSPFTPPILGNLHQLGSFPDHRSLRVLSQEHGPLILHFNSQQQEDCKMFFISSLFLALLLSTILFFHKQRKQTNLPPSPFKLPILSNLHQLGSSPHRSLRVLSQEHGPLMLLHLGLTPTLVVSSRDAAEEIMKTQDLIFSSRPSSFMGHKLLYGNKDLALAPYGEYWRQAKKMFIVELLSQKRVDSFRTVREEEIMNMMEKISSSSSSQLGLVNLSELLVPLNNDIICRVAFGKKYSQREGEDGGSGNERSRIKKLIEELSELMGSFYVGDFIPSLAWIGRLSGLVERAEKTSRKWDDLLEGIIMDHEDGKRETVDGTVKDFLDVLLYVKEDTSFGLPLTKDHIKALILDIFAAGTHTTYTTIEWIMAELLRNPKAMKKVQEEVRGIAVGKSMVTEDMLRQMNYLKSVVKETLRLHPPFPLLLPRESTKSSKIYGYDIPAKSRVIVNAWAIGRDPKSWEEPEKFHPERFMDGGNKSHVDFRGNDFELIPFGAGRRICPGIHFAISTVECTLANLLHKFDWKMPDGVDINMDEDHGIAVHKKTPLLLISIPCFTLKVLKMWFKPVVLLQVLSAVCLIIIVNDIGQVQVRFKVIHRQTFLGWIL